MRWLDRSPDTCDEAVWARLDLWKPILSQRGDEVRLGPRTNNLDCRIWGVMGMFTVVQVDIP